MRTVDDNILIEGASPVQPQHELLQTAVMEREGLARGY